MHSSSGLALKLRAQGAKNGIEVLLVGAVGLTFIMLVNLLRPTEISILEIFLVSACCAAIFVGFLKTQEPYYSLIITSQALTYNHKYGYWCLLPSNIQKVGVPEVEQGFDSLALNAVGIKLKSSDEFLMQLAPRIAGKLLIEQRNLFMQAVQKHCKNGHCPSEWLVEDNYYVSKDGNHFDGLLAMFANRMQHLQLLTGYDLLLPASVLDRSVWDFSYCLEHWRKDPDSFMKDHLPHE